MSLLSRVLAATLCATLCATPAACSDSGRPNGADPKADSNSGQHAQPAPAPAPGDAPARPPLPQFVDVAVEAGVAVQNHTGKPREKDWIVSGMGGGVIVLDYDGDGDMDFVVVDGTMITDQGELEFDPEWRTRLFRNDGGMRFTDVTEAAGIDIHAFGFGGASCDYDADGDADFYVCTWGRNYLMRNRGDGTFEDVTEAAGVLGDEADMSTSCAFGDVDGDGVHDLYVANYIDQWDQIRDVKSRTKPGERMVARTCRWRNYDVYCGPPGLKGQPDRLYLGNGDGTFRDVGKTNLLMGSGAEQAPHFGFQPVMSDFDGDGDLDVYVANDTQGNYLWINDGKGHFRERGIEAGVSMNRDVVEQAGMGVDVADVNRDGKLDLFVTNFSHDYNTLYVNRSDKGRPIFRDQTHQFSIADLSFHRLCWGTRLLDFDCDGELDMFVACGHVYGEVANHPETDTTYEQKNLLLRNLGPTKRYAYEDVTDRAGTAFQIRRVWRGAAFADFDDDGDLDVYVTALNETAALFRNDGGNAAGWLRMRLTGVGGQRDPSGARVTLHMPDGRPFVEELHHGASFCSDNDPRLFFGTGAVKVVPRMTVVWPGGATQEFEDVSTSKAYRLDQASGRLEEDRR